MAGPWERSESTRARNSMCAWVVYMCVCTRVCQCVRLLEWRGQCGAWRGGRGEAGEVELVPVGNQESIIEIFKLGW